MFVAEEIREAGRPSDLPMTAKSQQLGGECPLCRSLEAVYEARLMEYVEARASASYAVSKKVAAQKNVEMERARYELEEHRLDCVISRGVSGMPHKLGQLVA